MSEQRGGEKHVQAYQTMMERVKDALEQAKHIDLQQHIDNAVNKAVELNELSREEALRVGQYIRRDVHDAADFIARRDNDDDLGVWMRFDLELIEERILDTFQGMVDHMIDHTREELERISARAADMNTWHSGEVTGPGSLQCAECGYLLTYHKPKAIPPCPDCGETVFVRVSDEDE